MEEPRKLKEPEIRTTEGLTYVYLEVDPQPQQIISVSGEHGHYWTGGHEWAQPRPPFWRRVIGNAGSWLIEIGERLERVGY